LNIQYNGFKQLKVDTVMIKKAARRFVTLIEIMIVMFLIALITGVIAYNYRGSLEEGKIFKTRAGIQKIETILNLEIAKHPGLRSDISNQWQQILSHSAIVHDAKALSVDGWGELYNVALDPETSAVVVTSKKLDDYNRSNQSLLGE
jgi:general secretion pathway protein G